MSVSNILVIIVLISCYIQLLFIISDLYGNLTVNLLKKKVIKITNLNSSRGKFYLSTNCSKIELRQKHLSRLLELNNTNQYLYRSKSHNYKTNNTVVIGLSFGYDRDKLFIFITSLRKSLYNNEIILFVNENSHQDTLSFLIENKVTILFINEYWPYYSKSNNLYPLMERTLREKIPEKNLSGYFKFATIRYFLLNAFLCEYGDINKKYFFGDVKDIYFQSSPFDFLMPRGVLISEEPRNAKIKENPPNTRFMNKFFARNNKIYDNYIYNSGCVYFTYPEIVFLLDDMTRLIVENIRSDIEEQAPFIISLVDNPKEYYYFMHNGFGAVRNIGCELWEMKAIFNHTHFKVEEVFLVKENRILNYDCSVPLVIHMYNQFYSGEYYSFIMKKLRN